MTEVDHNALLVPCCFASRDGWQCDEPAGETGYCFWHDRKLDKSGQYLSAELESWAKAGKPLSGLQLARADLRQVNLVRSGSQSGYQCHDADFYRANLSGAHLFKLDARGASFMKADLTGANLHCADLRGCNLLGTILSHARLENITWGQQLSQEVQAHNCRDVRQANSAWQEAEEVARNIRKQCEKQGMFEQAGRFFQKEMRCRRMQLPRFSSKRLLSKVVDVFCGYGESPLRVVTFSLLLIFCSALLYFGFGTTTAGGVLRFSPDLSMAENLKRFLNALYFSIVTFTTLGYGDIAPTGFSRLIASIEAFLGSFTMALFVVVFVKKMTR